MKLSEIKQLDESQLEEGPILNAIGTGVGKVAGTVAKGVGAVAGGVAGLGAAMKKGYQAGKGVTSQGGDDLQAAQQAGTQPASTPTQGAVQQAPAQGQPAQAQGAVQQAPAQASATPAQSTGQSAPAAQAKGADQQAAGGAEQPAQQDPGAAKNPLFKDANAFKTAWDQYVASRTKPDSPYQLISDPEMLQTLKDMWMRTGGTKVQESNEYINKRNMLIESIVKREPIYESVYSASRYLTEAQLTQEQIKELFKQIADAAKAGKNTDTGEPDASSNRTLLGKGADVGAEAKKKVTAAWDKVKTAISQSGPVSGFDVMVDKLQSDIMTKLGGKGGTVGTMLQKYREFAKAHPVMQGAVYAIFVAAAATLAGVTGPAGLAAVAGGLKLADRMLQGDKASSAIWKAAKTGAITYGAASLAQGLAGAEQTPQEITSTVPPEQVVTHVVQKGDTLSQIAQANGTSVQALMKANPLITNPDAIQVGTQITIPPLNAPTYMGGVGTASDTASKVATGDYTSASQALASQNAALQGAGQTAGQAAGVAGGATGGVDQAVTAGMKALQDQVASGAIRSQADLARAISDISNQAQSGIVDAAIKAQVNAPGGLASQVVGTVRESRNQWIDYKATNRVRRIDESVGLVPTAVYITEAAVQHIFKQTVKEGIWDSIKKAAKSGWEGMTNKITYDKLDMNWRRNFGDNPQEGPVDVEVVKEFLRKQGVKDALINSVLAGMQLDQGGEQPQAGAEEPAQAQTTGAEQPQTDAEPSTAQEPAKPAAGGAGGITDGKALADAFKKFQDADGSMAPAVRGVLKDILLTAVGTVQESIAYMKFKKKLREAKRSL